MSSATCDNYMIARTNEWNIYVAPAHSTPSLVVFDEADSALTVAPGSVTGCQLGWNIPANSAREITASDSICGVSFKCNSAASHLMIGMASQPITAWGDFDYGITCRGAWSNNVDTFENGQPTFEGALETTPKMPQMLQTVSSKSPMSGVRM